VLIEAHNEKLDSLWPVKDPKKVTALCHLQLTIQSHIIALEGLGHSKKSFGSYLGRKLVKILPHKLKEKWGEEATNDITNIDWVLKFIREQTEVAERFNRLKTADKIAAQSIIQKTEITTASQFAIGAKSRPASSPKPNFKPKTKYSPSRSFKCTRECIFCNDWHFPDACQKTLAETKKIAGMKRCTNCFNLSQKNKDCTSDRTCYKCEGRHH
jgi:hypothetical protein